MASRPLDVARLYVRVAGAYRRSDLWIGRRGARHALHCKIACTQWKGLSELMPRHHTTDGKEQFAE